VLRERANHDLPAVIDHASRLLDSASFSEQEAWQRRDQGAELIRHIDALWEHVKAHDCSDSVIEQVLALRRWAVCQLTCAAAAGRAVHLAEEVHTDHLRRYGQVDPERIASLHDLAVVYQHIGRLDDAVGRYEQTLATARQVLGDDDPNTLIMAGNLASAYRDAGQWDAAITLLDGMIPKSGARSAMTTRSLERASAISRPHMSERDGADDAVRLFGQVLASARRLFGDDHRSTLEAADGLAFAYQATGRSDMAIQVLEPVLTASQRKLGDEHPDMLRAASNLAGMYAAAGRLDETIPRCERTLGH